MLVTGLRPVFDDVPYPIRSPTRYPGTAGLGAAPGARPPEEATILNRPGTFAKTDLRSESEKKPIYREGSRTF
jgi:hypothetical protein